MTPRRIRRSRARGSRLPESAVVVTRPTKFGNPFPASRYGQTSAVAMYRSWIEHSLPGQEIAEVARRELRGKDLACWCALDAPCHADVLLDVANR